MTTVKWVKERVKFALSDYSRGLSNYDRAQIFRSIGTRLRLSPLEKVVAENSASHNTDSESLLCPVTGCGSKLIWNRVSTTEMKCGNCGYTWNQ